MVLSYTFEFVGTWVLQEVAARCYRGSIATVFRLLQKISELHLVEFVETYVLQVVAARCYRGSTATVLQLLKKIFWGLLHPRELY